MKDKQMSSFFAEQVTDGEKVGRVCSGTHGIYRLTTVSSEMLEARLPGSFYYEAKETRNFPAVGDWIVYEPLEQKGKAIIRRILNRKSILSRKKAGNTTEEQIMAANVDIVFVVTALTKEFNLRRLERYIQQVYESGARPVIVCTKSDLCDDVEAKCLLIESIAPGVSVYAINNLTGEGVSDLREEISEGETVSLIGSSGVGKSTLINRLLQTSIQETKQVREKDDRGRHTTTHRELFPLPDGGYVIDTPGMRELQLWGDADSVNETFSEIESLKEQCKFRDCQHDQEPGCAVQKAIKDGEIDEARLKNYNKLKRELVRLEWKEKYGQHKTNRMLHGPNKKKMS
ncbi:ribosome small subunit-dependent GTPase A [Halobacillus fulvus]|nr:ribosome small subunit-dependent GTPase A [Halobacillus fulvus]